jgi:uncharacterized protein (DUF608 family)
VDGQLGTIVRLCRDWKLSGDDEFLREVWPSAARALDFAFDYWDNDGDLLLDAPQHTTYDIELHGPNPLGGVMFLAALHAGAELAEHLGDAARAHRYRGAAAASARRLEETLWNGEFYVQHLDDVDTQPFQQGAGCLSDQLLGQLLAHVAGLGYVLPPERVKQTLASIHRHNFRPTLSGERNFQRAFALDDEAGLLLCSWPNGGRPRQPFRYSEEVWTGTEYGVAAHLIYEGMVEEGLEIVRAVRARHDGFRRNPWNEVEAGNHYARSMASWAVLLAYSGFDYDAARHSLRFAPCLVDESFRCFFSTGSGWGTFERREGGSTIRLLYGTLVLASVAVDGRHKTFDEPVTLSAGDILAIE